MTIFWDIAPCSLVETDRHFRGAYCLNLQGNALMMDAVNTSEMSINLYQTAWCNIPEESSS
jgi:hypothetical protein